MVRPAELHRPARAAFITGQSPIRKTFKVYIDGYNLMPYLKGEIKKNPREGFLYWSDDGDLIALRVGNWKAEYYDKWSRSGSAPSIGNQQKNAVHQSLKVTSSDEAHKRFAGIFRCRRRVD